METERSVIRHQKTRLAIPGAGILTADHFTRMTVAPPGLVREDEPDPGAHAPGY